MWESVGDKRYKGVRGVREYLEDVGMFGGFVFCERMIKKRLKDNQVVIRKKRIWTNMIIVEKIKGYL